MIKVLMHMVGYGGVKEGVNNKKKKKENLPRKRKTLNIEHRETFRKWMNREAYLSLSLSLSLSRVKGGK
jgi:hypothetical protein